MLEVIKEINNNTKVQRMRKQIWYAVYGTTANLLLNMIVIKKVLNSGNLKFFSVDKIYYA